MRQLFLTALACALALTWASTAAAQNPPLGSEADGEILVSNGFPGGGDPVDVNADCNPDGTSTITYSTSGNAYGP